MRFSILSLLAVSTLVLVGCNQSSSPTSDIAVVDLNEVAKNLGSDIQIIAAVEERKENLNRQLRGAKTNYESQLRSTKNELGKELTAEQTQQLLKLKKQANQQLLQVAQQAKANLDQHRVQLTLEFKKEAKKVVEEVAEEKGLSLVVTKNDSVVLLYDDAVDITSEVTDRMRAVQPASYLQPTETEQP